MSPTTTQAFKAKSGPKSLASARKPKVVRVTVELPETFIRLLQTKASLSRWTDWSADAKAIPPTMDAGSILAWLVLQEARGQHENAIHAATPMEWRMAGGPELVHTERRVYEVDPDGTRHLVGGFELVAKPEDAQ